MQRVIYTIGYQGKTIDEFVQKLVDFKVNVLCDVRKNAISRKKGFSKNALSKTLKDANIFYTHIPELGIDSDKRKLLKTKDDYNKLMDDYEEDLQTKSHTLGLVSLRIHHGKIALMCFEADHNWCHRSRLARILQQSIGFDCQIVHL